MDGVDEQEAVTRDDDSAGDDNDAGDVPLRRGRGGTVGSVQSMDSAQTARSTAAASAHNSDDGSDSSVAGAERSHDDEHAKAAVQGIRRRRSRRGTWGNTVRRSLRGGSGSGVRVSRRKGSAAERLSERVSMSERASVRESEASDDDSASETVERVPTTAVRESSKPLTLVVDGATLEHILKDKTLSINFLVLGRQCRSVVCCASLASCCLAYCCRRSP